MPDSTTCVDTQVQQASDDSHGRQFQKACYTIAQRLRNTPPLAETLDTRYWIEIESEKVGDVMAKLYVRPLEDIEPSRADALPSSRNTKEELDFSGAEHRDFLQWLHRNIAETPSRYLPDLEDFGRVQERANILDYWRARARLAFVYNGPSPDGEANEVGVAQIQQTSHSGGQNNPDTLADTGGRGVRVVVSVNVSGNAASGDTNGAGGVTLDSASVRATQTAGQ